MGKCWATAEALGVMETEQDGSFALPLYFSLDYFRLQELIYAFFTTILPRKVTVAAVTSVKSVPVRFRYWSASTST